MSIEVPSPSSLRRVLVTKLRHHGDVLLASPVIATLKRIAPQAEVDALVYADTAPMLEGHPALAQLHPIDRGWKRQGVWRQGAAEWALISALRARHYDLVVHLSVHTRVAALCDALAAKGLPIVMTSAPDAGEKALIAEVRAARGKGAAAAFDFSGQLSLKELAALTARARLFVGVDSAPMHMAAAMGTPVVGIFGPSGDSEWGPWSEPGTNRHRVVASNTHPCRPCGMAGCNDSKLSDCLTSLPVARVLAACEELLA
jgi:ADP-heptose:LPS heptosyltransferase